MENVVLDIGNYYFKYNGASLGYFSSKINTKFEANAESYERVEYDEKIALIGSGELDREYSKADKEGLTHQILYAITKATVAESINLCLLLPINQITKKQIFIDRFENKIYEFKVNGIKKRIKINKFAVLPEGQCSYYSLKNKSKYQLIIEIGSRTVNWVAYECGKLVKSGTEKIGVFDLYKTIKEIENSKGEDYTEEDIEHQLRRGRVVVSDETYKKFLKDILNRIKANINIKNYDTCFAGGGAEDLKNIIRKIPNVTIHPAAFYSNVLGAEEVIKRMWK